MHVCIDEYTQSPPESERHEYESRVVHDESEGVIILKESCHGEEIAPVVCLFTHTTDERKWASTRIWDIECNICEILSKPPETDTRSIRIRFSHEEYIDDDTWDDHLHETPAEYCHELTEWHEYNMSCFMEYEIREVYPGVHHSSIDTERVELQRV